MEEQTLNTEQSSLSKFEEMELANVNLREDEEQDNEIPEDEEAEEVTLDSEAEESTEDQEANSEEVEGEDESEELEQEAEFSTIKVSGKEYQVTPEVADAHKSMEADYTQKTMKLGEDRKALEGTLQEVNNFAALVYQSINKPIATLEEKQKLHAEGDTDELARIQLEEEAQRNRVSQFSEQAQRLNRVIAEKQAEESSKHREKCFEYLQSNRPELIETERLSKNTEFLKSTGFGLQEIKAIADPKVIEVIDMARQFSEGKTKLATLKKEVKKAPKVVKGKGRVNSKGKKQANLDKARASVRKTGSGLDYFLQQELNKGK